MNKSFLTRLMEEFGHGGHSIFAPSGSARWLECAGSLIACLFEEDKTSFEAAEGTVAHEIADNWIRSGHRPNHLIDTVQVLEENGTKHGIYISRSMLDYLQEYVDWCVYEEGVMYTERKVWFTDLMPRANPDDPESEPIPFVDQGGTADNIIFRDKTLIITDLKYGTGVQVFAENNTQAQFYAYGAYQEFKDKYEIENIVIRIAQPRLEHFDVWEITVEDLLKFAEYAKKRIAAAWNIDATRKASVKGCRFCLAAHNCAALAYIMECAVGGDVEFLESEFGEYEMSVLRDALAEEYKFRRAQFGKLSTEEMAKIQPWRKVVENWFARLDFELEARALKGEKIPGHKLVEARSNRRFISDEKAIELFEFLEIPEEKYIKRKLLSPAQMEEVIRDEVGVTKAAAPNVIESVVFKPEGKPTLVPLTDKRPPIDGKYAGAYDDEDEIDDDEV